MTKTFNMLKCASVCLLGALLLTVVWVDRLEAQVATASISGTTTDSSGAVLVGATVEAKNVATNIAQSTVTDAQGRYTILDLPVGSYDIQASTSGFQTVVHRGITLTVGANPIVDFALSVGQTTQSVTVEAQLSQVETQTASISSLMTTTQMHDLPLNGRNFQQLISLAPGVQTVPAAAAEVGISSTFYGGGATYSVSGSRPVGEAFLLDNQDLEGYWNKGAGVSVTGNSLGVEAIAEFQLLTNTYSAQFGGTGAAMNAVSKSGTNDFHGSAYDYLRNSVLDARNFFDGPTIPEFRRNQFGGSVGGPVKKDKAFFFVNYEGLRSSQGFTGNEYVPDAQSRLGNVPCNLVTGQLPPSEGGTCTNGARVAVPVDPAVVPYLAIWPQTTGPELNEPTGPAGGLFPGYPSGAALFTNVASQIVDQNYILARMDYTLGPKDSFFGRYISDTAYQYVPFPLSALPLWPEVDNAGDQFFTLEEKHIVSATEINEVRFSFTRTNERANEGARTNPATDLMQFYPGSGREDGSIIISGGVSPIGAGSVTRFFARQTKFIGGDDLFWTHGAHSLKAGVSIARVQSSAAAGTAGGNYNFSSLPDFLAGVPSLFIGQSNPAPGFNRSRFFREIDYAPYIEDDWKIRPNLTLNLGLRYDFGTNPVCVAVPCTNLIDPLSSTAFVQVHHVLQANPNGLNFDPRIGLAWDPFSNHKTSIRAGFGIFHEQMSARTFGTAYALTPPSVTEVAFTIGFPNPAPGAALAPPAVEYGLDYRANVSPYQVQYNLTIQHDLGHGMTASIGYVGAQGVHLYSQRNQNTPAVVGGPSTCTSPSCFFFGPVPNPNFLSINNTAPTSHSTYNSVVANLSRQISRNLIGQVSYTYSRCIDDGSGSSGLEQATQEVTDVYNQRYDRAACTFNITQTLRGNAVYQLPFKGNRLVEGWEVSPILSANTGLPVNVYNGLDPQQSLTGGLTGDRPDYSGAAGCHPYQILDQVNVAQRTVQWFNPACYTLQPFGTLGNVGRDSLYGPSFVDLDFSIIKDTKVTEKLSAQFRAEFFDIINHTNLAQPANGLYTGVVYVPASVLESATAGQITATSGPSRQIQFAVKLTF
ncbi:MAG: TonB-dependent receptor [Candidatus Acidiferrales bacterium]|jgi:hypothetical protein